MVQNSAWEGHIHYFGRASGGVKWLVIWNWKLIPNLKFSIFWVRVLGRGVGGGGGGQLVMKNFRFNFGSASNLRWPSIFTFSLPLTSMNKFRLGICNIWSNLRWSSVFTHPFQKRKTSYLRHPTSPHPPHPHLLQHWTGVKPQIFDTKCIIPANIQCFTDHSLLRRLIKLLSTLLTSQPHMFVQTSLNENWFYC